AAQAQAPSRCLDPSVTLSVEESRLTFTLPDNDNPGVLQDKPFAQQMIEGAGFQDFSPRFVDQLCRARSLEDARTVVTRHAELLWRMAVDRAQQRGRVRGDLPYSDDRPLYWTRLQASAAIRQWTPRFSLFLGDRLALVEQFDRASRGMFDINFPAGKQVKRV